VCRREIDWYRQRADDSVTFRDVSQTDADPAPDLPRDAALARFHVRRPNGELVSGAAAFLELWAAMPALAPIARVLKWRPILALLDAGYDGFLRIRPLWRKA
jgi:predicted DCC family thiol-disulfide oxidoreductase YuxK